MELGFGARRSNWNLETSGGARNEEKISEQDELTTPVEKEVVDEFWFHLLMQPLFISI